MLVFAGAVIVVAITVLLMNAASKPDTFRIERSATIHATPDKLFPFINDFHKWIAWSPWEKSDPALARTYRGAVSGKGAVYEWEGNRKVGQGRMEIRDTAPPSRILIKLDFLKPFEAHNTAEFTLKSGERSTDVTWAMYVPQPYMAKIMCLFFSMDTVVGEQFERGLATLKIVSEQ